MGFALWTAPGLAWAQGTHEYKPMGAAVISATDLFRQRDFDPSRSVPEKAADYVGLFASIVDLNDWLEKRRSSSGGDDKPPQSRVAVRRWQGEVPPGAPQVGPERVGRPATRR